MQRRLVIGDLADKFSLLRGVEFHRFLLPYADFSPALTDIFQKHAYIGQNGVIQSI